MTSAKVVFEVYRKMPQLNLTISLLCNLTDKVEYLNKNDIWMRRKDLSGAHLKIGYFPDLSFCFEINQVFFSLCLQKYHNIFIYFWCLPFNDQVV